MSAAPPSPAPRLPIADYDVVVVGATPGGIACAVRSAREGLRVALVEESRHVGGMWAAGLQVFDTRYSGHRCPVLSEFTARLEEHYRRHHGEGSPDHAMARFGESSVHGQRPRFEPHVAEQVFRDLLGDAPGVVLHCGYRLEAVDKAGDVIAGLVFAAVDAPGERLRLGGRIFVDCTYEADLAAAAGAPLRTGRESREAFGEPHAGRLFTTIEPIGESGRRVAEALHLHYFNRTSRARFPGSTGQGDSAVQAYTVRLTLTDAPENRREIEAPGAYERERYLGILDRGPEAHLQGYPFSSHYLREEIEKLSLGMAVPNRKVDWLGANFVGANHGYPGADRAERRRIYRRHVDHALGMMHFLQHDPAVPRRLRDRLRPWGLARDEYRDTGGIPWTMYVREARRLDGLHVFTEHDGRKHAGHGRSPVRPDSVAFAEWPMDSHDCNPVRQKGSFNDGEFILAEETLPSQIPYRCLVCSAVDNLLVPVALSATHVGWGTLRLEPVFVHTGEAAGVAAAFCLLRNLSPRRLDGSVLQGELLRRGIAVAYFSDIDLGSGAEWVRDIQYLGSRGFFGGYAARPDGRTGAVERRAWPEILSHWIGGKGDPDACAALACQRAGRARQVAPGEPAAALLREIAWEQNPPPTVREASQRLAAAVRSLDGAGVSR